MAADLPDRVRRDVVLSLYAQFDELRWEQVSTSESATAYERFVTDSAIGGKLAPHMPAGQIRVWIKDGPAKEYRRALEGVGSYASYTSRQYPGPQAIIESALGVGWHLRPGSLDHKPMRCRAVKQPEGERYVLWGPLFSLKELIWRGALHVASGSSVPVDVAVTKPTIAPLAADDWRLVSSLCEVIGATPRQLTHMAQLKPGWTPPK